MPLICYIKKRFNTRSVDLIKKANAILAEYAGAGYGMTLRQLYYQLVSRDFIPNNIPAYKSLSKLLSDARIAGLIDWNSMSDGERSLKSLSTWPNPKAIVDSAVESYLTDKWADQPFRLEVWIEKNALLNVIKPICHELEVPYFSCKGYTSQTALWEAAQRLAEYTRAGKEVVVIHLGDHDPSGKDMTRDILERLELFAPDSEITVDRIALNMDQVKKYKPPHNPAKEKDSRFAQYKKKFGEKCWELDALTPQVISDLISKKVSSYLDDAKWDRAVKMQEAGRRRIKKLARKLK